MEVNLSGKINGMQTTIEIKKSFEVPVVFFTSDIRFIDSIKLAQPEGFILKPLNNKVLKATIETVVFKYRKEQQEAKLKAENKKKLKKAKIVEEPEDSDEIVEAMPAVKQRNSFIFVRADYKLNKIELDEIYYIEAQKDYVLIHTHDNNFTTHATMKQMEKLLPTHDFMRIHRSYIIRLDKIFSIKYPDLTIEDKMKVIQIGGLYKKELYKKLNIN